MLLAKQPTPVYNERYSTQERGSFLCFLKVYRSVHSSALLLYCLYTATQNSRLNRSVYYLGYEFQHMTYGEVSYGRFKWPFWVILYMIVLQRDANRGQTLKRYSQPYCKWNTQYAVGYGVRPYKATYRCQFWKNRVARQPSHSDQPSSRGLRFDHLPKVCYRFNLP